MEWLDIAIISFVSGLTAVISAVVGMAGGIVLLSVMTFFMSIETIVPIHGVVQLASNGFRSFSLRDNIEWRIFWPSLIGIPLGTGVAVYFISSIERRELFYFLIAGLIFYVLFRPKKLPALIIPFPAFGILGFVVGLLNPLIGATGPILAPFFLRPDLKKEQIVATKACTQALGHFLKLPAFIYLGFAYEDYVWLLIGMILAVLLGTYYGVSILKSLPEKAFRIIFKTALFIAALRVLYKGVMAL